MNDFQKPKPIYIKFLSVTKVRKNNHVNNINPAIQFTLETENSNYSKSHS